MVFLGKENLCLIFGHIHSLKNQVIWSKDAKIMPPQKKCPLDGIFKKQTFVFCMNKHFLLPNVHSKFEKWTKFDN